VKRLDWLEMDEGDSAFQFPTQENIAIVIYILLIFISTNYVIKLSVHFFSKFLVSYVSLWRH
jgi:hypothetical protein